MPELIISPASRRDLADQTAYYRDQGTPATANRWLVKTRKAFELVAAHPGMGEEVRPGLRAWRVEKFKQHVVIYRATPDSVEIVRVLHGASDLDSALGGYESSTSSSTYVEFDVDRAIGRGRLPPERQHAAARTLVATRVGE